MTAFYLSEIVKLIEELNTYHCGSAQAFRFELGELYFTVRFMQEDVREDFSPVRLDSNYIGYKLLKHEASDARKALQSIIDKGLLNEH